MTVQNKEPGSVDWFVRATGLLAEAHRRGITAPWCAALADAVAEVRRLRAAHQAPQRVCPESDQVCPYGCKDGAPCVRLHGAVGAQPAKPGKPYHDPEFCELEHPGKPCPQSGSLKLTVPTHGMTPLYLATMFHEAYERLAPSFGYETRPDTRSFDPDSKNGRLMVATCAAILDRVRMPVAAVGAQAASTLQRAGVDSLLNTIHEAIGDLAEGAAHELDHHGSNCKEWYRAVKNARLAVAVLKELHKADTTAAVGAQAAEQPQAARLRAFAKHCLNSGGNYHVGEDVLREIIALCDARQSVAAVGAAEQGEPTLVEWQNTWDFCPNCGNGIDTGGECNVCDFDLRDFARPQPPPPQAVCTKGLRTSTQCRCPKCAPQAEEK